VSVVNIAQTRILALNRRILALNRLFIQFSLTGLIEAKSSITSPVQEALRDALKKTENHNRLFIQFSLTGLSPIQEALRDALKKTENHNGRGAIH